MSEYLREAALTKPDNVTISLHRYGAHIQMFDSRGIQQKTIAWGEVETSNINPITATIEMMMK